MRTTYMAKAGEVERKWYVVDATDIPMGRLSAVVASVLRGKNKPTFTPHTDTGDFVIVINAEKVKLTGKKDSGKNIPRSCFCHGAVSREIQKRMMSFLHNDSSAVF